MDTAISTDETAPFAAARFIREIGRGKEGARSMSVADACLLYRAMLDGRVSDLELGGILLAMRIKGEAVSELIGFLQAAHAAMPSLAVPATRYAPILIPSYNGARNMANLTPLLALLLARAGAPVLMHGVQQDAGRVTSAEVLAALDLPSVQNQQEMHAAWAQGLPAFMPIAVLAPKMAKLLSLRRILGVRSSTHTLVKILQPFATPALRLTSYTHPEYHVLLSQYLATPEAAALGDTLLMRATEGETVANARRAREIEWFDNGVCTSLVQKQEVAESDSDLPLARDAASTAQWIKQVLAGEKAIPDAIAEQVAQCLVVAEKLKANRLSDTACPA